MLATFLISCSLFGCETIDQSNLTERKNVDHVFLDILVRNASFSCVILLGALFFNVSTVCLIAFNGYSWGLSFMQVFCLAGGKTAFILFAPHGLIELVWITISVQISVKLSMVILDLFRNKILPSIFIQEIKKQLPKLGICFVLIMIGALVESFITPYLYLKL